MFLSLFFLSVIVTGSLFWYWGIDYLFHISGYEALEELEKKLR